MRALKWMMFLMALTSASFAGHCLAPESPYQKMRCAELLGSSHAPIKSVKTTKNTPPLLPQKTIPTPPLRLTPQQTQPRIAEKPSKPASRPKRVTQPSPQKPAQTAPQYGTTKPKEHHRFKLY